MLATTPTTIPKYIWQRAIDAQSACNLGGLVKFLDTAITAIRASGVTNTDDINRHPLVQLIVCQLVHLSYGGSEIETMKFSDAYAFVSAEAEKP